MFLETGILVSGVFMCVMVYDCILIILFYCTKSLSRNQFKIRNKITKIIRINPSFNILTFWIVSECSFDSVVYNVRISLINDFQSITRNDFQNQKENL